MMRKIICTGTIFATIIGTLIASVLIRVPTYWISWVFGWDLTYAEKTYPLIMIVGCNLALVFVLVWLSIGIVYLWCVCGLLCDKLRGELR